MPRKGRANKSRGGNGAGGAASSRSGDSEFDAELDLSGRAAAAASAGRGSGPSGDSSSFFAQMMARMMMQGGWRDKGEDEEEAPRRPNAAVREQLLRDHNAMVQALANPSFPYSAGLSFPGAATQPRRSTPVPDWRTLQPIGIGELRLGQVHSGRYLRGRLLTDAAAMVGVATVLEDSHGDACRLSVYNFPGIDSQRNTQARNELGRRCMPKGRECVIVEPFYKVGPNTPSLCNGFAVRPSAHFSFILSPLNMSSSDGV